MSTFFKPYEGSRPFLFVSYARLQSKEVVDTIRILHEKNWRVWYDEGIPAGSDWPANIARHVHDCERVIFFVSQRALDSRNCYSEMRAAANLGKPILLVWLEDCTLDDRWRELLGNSPEIPRLESAAERADAILRSGFLLRRFHLKWTEKIPWRALGLAASLLFFFVSTAALVLLATGRWDPVPPVSQTPEIASAPEGTPLPEVVDIGEAEQYFAVRFPDSLQEDAIRYALGIRTGEIYRGQLADLRELYLCGGLPATGFDKVRFEADGTCRVNGAPVFAGPVSDLSVLRYAVRLESLALISQPLDDLTPLNGHVLLRELSLAGSTVADLGGLSQLPSLETLHLEHTAVSDLTPLDGLSGLKTVTVSRDMLPLTWNKNAAFSVVLVT